MLFDSKTASIARATAQGYSRAAFWRAQGWPNLRLAWEGRARYCRELREKRAKLAAQTGQTPRKRSRNLPLG